MLKAINNSDQPSPPSLNLISNAPNRGVANAKSAPPEGHRLTTIGIHYKAPTEIIDFTLSTSYIFVATKNTTILLSAANSVLISRQSFKFNVLRVGAAWNDTCLYVITEDGILYILQSFGKSYSTPSVRAVDLVHSLDAGRCIDLAIDNRTNMYAPVMQLNRTISDVHMEIDPTNHQSFMLSFHVDFNADLRIPSFNALLYCSNFSQITPYYLRNRITAMCFGNLGLSFIGDITGRVYILMTSESLRQRVQNQPVPASDASPNGVSSLANFIFFERVYPEHIKQIHILSPVTLFLGYIDGMMLTINIKTKAVMKHDIACTNTYQSGRLKTKITGKPGIKARVLLGSDPLLGKFCISKHTEAQKRALRDDQSTENISPLTALNAESHQPPMRDFLTEYIELKERLAKEQAEGVMQELLDTFVEEWECGSAHRQSGLSGDEIYTPKQSTTLKLPRPSVILTKGFESSQIASIDDYLVLFTCFKGYLVAFNLTAYDNAISRPVYLENMTTSGLYKCSASEKPKKNMQLRIHNGRLLVSMVNTIHTISLPQFLLPLISYIPRFGNYRFYSQGERDILGNSEEDYPYDVRVIFESADLAQQSLFMKGCKELGSNLAPAFDSMIDLSVKTAISASAADQFMDSHLYQTGGTPISRSGSTGQGAGALSKSDPRSPVQLLKQLREKRMKSSPGGRSFTPKTNEEEPRFRTVLSDRVALADAHLRMARETLIREKMLDQIMRRFEYGQDDPDNYRQLSPRQGNYDRYKRISCNEIDRYDHTRFFPVTNISGEVIMGRHRRVHSLNFEQDYRKVIDDKMRQSGDGLLHSTVGGRLRERARDRRIGSGKGECSDANLALSDLLTDASEVLSQSSSTLASISGGSFRTSPKCRENGESSSISSDISQDKSGGAFYHDSQHITVYDNSMRPVVDLSGQSPTSSVGHEKNNHLLNDPEPQLSGYAATKNIEQSISNIISCVMSLPEAADHVDRCALNQHSPQIVAPPSSSDATNLEERKIDSIVSFILSTHKHTEESCSELPVLKPHKSHSQGNSTSIPAALPCNRTPQMNDSLESDQRAWPRVERVSELYSISKLLSRNRKYASMASAMVHILKLSRRDETDDKIKMLLHIHRRQNVFSFLARTGLFTDSERAILTETLDDARFYYQQLGVPAIDINQIKPSTIEGVSQWRGYLDSHNILPHKLTDLKPDMYFKHPGRNMTSAMSTRWIPKAHKSDKEPSLGASELRRQEREDLVSCPLQPAKELSSLQVYSLQTSSSTPGITSLRKSLSLSTGAMTTMTAPPSSAPHSLSLVRTSNVSSSKSKDFIYPSKSGSSPVAREASFPTLAGPSEGLPADISVVAYSESNTSHLEEKHTSACTAQQGGLSNAPLSGTTQPNILADFRRESRPTNSRDGSMDSSTSADDNNERSNSSTAMVHNEHRIFRSSPKSSQLFSSHFRKETLKASKSDPQTLRPKLRPPDILYPIASSDQIEEHKALSASTSSALQPLPRAVHQKPMRPSSLPSSRFTRRISSMETLLPRETHHAWLKSRAQTRNTVRVTVFTGIPKYYDMRTRIEYAHKHHFNMLQQRDLTDSVEPVGSLVYKVSRPLSVQGPRCTDAGSVLTPLFAPQAPFEGERHGSNLLTDDGSFISTTQSERADVIHRPRWFASETSRKLTSVPNDASVLSAIEFYPLSRPDTSDVRSGPTLIDLNQQLTHVLDALSMHMYGEKEKRFLTRYTESITGALIQQVRRNNAQSKPFSPTALEDRGANSLDRRPSAGTPMHQGVLLDRGLPLSSLAKLSSALGNIVYKLTIMRQAAYRQTTEKEAIEARDEMWNAAVTEINRAFPNMLHVSSEPAMGRGLSPEKISVSLNNNGILSNQSVSHQISPVKEKKFKEPQRLTWKIGAANVSSAALAPSYRYLHDTETRSSNENIKPVDKAQFMQPRVARDGVQSARYMRSLAQARTRFAPYSLKDVLQVFSYLDVGVGANGEIRSLNADRLTKIYRADSDIYGCADNEETSSGEHFWQGDGGGQHPSLDSQQMKESLEKRRSTSFQHLLPRESVESLNELLPRYEFQTDQNSAPPVTTAKQVSGLRGQKTKAKLRHPLLEDASLIQTILADYDILPAQHTFDSQTTNTAIQVKRKDLVRLLLRMVDSASQPDNIRALEPLLPQVVKNDSIFKEQLFSFLHEKRGLMEQHAIRIQDLMQTQKRFEEVQEQAISLQTMQRSAEGVVYDSRVSLMGSTGKSICEQLQDTDQPLEVSTLDLINMNVTRYSDKPSVLLHSVVLSPMKFHTMRRRTLAAKKTIQDNQSLEIPELIVPSIFIGTSTENLTEKNLIRRQPNKGNRLRRNNLTGSQTVTAHTRQDGADLNALRVNLAFPSNLHSSLIQGRNASGKELQDRYSYASNSTMSLSTSARVKSLQPIDPSLTSSFGSSKALATLPTQQHNDFNLLPELADSITSLKPQTTQNHDNTKRTIGDHVVPARPDMVAKTQLLELNDSTCRIHPLSNKEPSTLRSSQQTSMPKTSKSKDASLVDRKSITPFDSAPEVGLADAEDANTLELKENQNLMRSRSSSAVSFPSDILTSQSHDSLNGSVSEKSRGHGTSIPAVSGLAQDSIHSGLPPRPSSGALRPAASSPRPECFSSIQEHVKGLHHPSELINLRSRDRDLLLSMSHRSPYNLRRPDIVLSALGLKVPSKADTPLPATAGKARTSSHISPTSSVSSASSTRRTSKSNSFSYSRSSSPARWSDDSDTFVGAVITQMRSPRASSKKPSHKSYRYGTLTPTEGFSIRPGRSRSCCDFLRRTSDGYSCAVQTCFLDFQSHDHTQTDPSLSADVFFSGPHIDRVTPGNIELSDLDLTSGQLRSFSTPMLPFSSICNGSVTISHVPSQSPSTSLHDTRELIMQSCPVLSNKKTKPQEPFGVQLTQIYQRYITAKTDSFKRDAAAFRSQQLIVLSEYLTSLSTYLYPLTQKILHAEYHGILAFGTYTEVEMQASGLKKHKRYFYYNMPQLTSEAHIDTCLNPEFILRQRLDSLRFMGFLHRVFSKLSNSTNALDVINRRCTPMHAAIAVSNRASITTTTDMVYPEGRRRLILYTDHPLVDVSVADYDREITNTQNLLRSTENVLLIPPRSKSAQRSCIDRQSIHQRPTSHHNASRSQSMSFQASRSSSPSYHSDLHHSFTITSGKSFDTALRSTQDQHSIISNRHVKPKQSESKARRARSFEELRKLERYSSHSLTKDTLYDDCNIYYSISHWKYSLSKNCCVHRPVPSMTLFGRRWNDSHGAVIPSAETRSIVHRRIRSRLQCSKISKSTENVLQNNYVRFYPDVSYYTLGAYNIRQYSPITSAVPTTSNLLQPRMKSLKDFLDTSISDEELVFSGVYMHNHTSTAENCCLAFETSLILASKVVRNIESCFNKKLIVDAIGRDVYVSTPRPEYLLPQKKNLSTSILLHQSASGGTQTKDFQISSGTFAMHTVAPRGEIYNSREDKRAMEHDKGVDFSESSIHELSSKLYDKQRYIGHLHSLTFSSARLASAIFPSGLRFLSVDCLSGPIEASFLNTLNAQYWGLAKSWDLAYSDAANVLTSATSAYVTIAERTKNIMLLTLSTKEDTSDDPEIFLKGLLTCRYDRYKYNRLRAQEEQLYEICPDTLPDLSRVGRRKRNRIMNMYDIFGRRIAPRKTGGSISETQKPVSKAALADTEVSHTCDQRNVLESRPAITLASYSEKSTYKSLLESSIGKDCLSENREIGEDIGPSSMRLTTHVFTVDIQRMLSQSFGRERLVSTPSRGGQSCGARELTKEIVITRGTHALAGHTSITPTTENSRPGQINHRRAASARPENQLSGIKTCINTFARSQSLCHSRQLPTYLMEIIILQASESFACSLSHIFRHREAAVYFKTMVEKEFVPTITKQTTPLSDLPPCTATSGFAHVLYGSESVLDTYSLVNRKAECNPIGIYSATHLRQFIMLPVDYIDYRSFLLHTKTLNKHVMDVSAVLQSQRAVKSLEVRNAQISQLMENTRAYSNDTASCYDLWNRLVFNMHHVLNIQAVRLYSERFENLLQQHDYDLDLLIEKALTLNSEYYTKHPAVFREYQIRRHQKEVEHKAELERIRYLMMEVMRNWRLHGPIYNISGLLLISYRKGAAFKEALQRYFPIANEEPFEKYSLEPSLNTAPFGTGEMPITARERAKESEASEKSDKTLLLSYRSTRPTTGTSHSSGSQRFASTIVSERELDMQHRMRHLFLSRLVMIEFSTRLFEAQHKNNMLTSIQYMVLDDLDSVFSQLPLIMKSSDTLFKRISMEALTSGKSKVGAYDYMYGVNSDEMEAKEIRKTRENLEARESNADLADSRSSLAKNAAVSMAKELSRPHTALPVSDIKLTMVKDGTPSPLAFSPTKTVALALKMNNLDMLSRDIKQRLDRLQRGDLDEFDGSIVEFISQSESFFSMCEVPDVQEKLDDLSEEQSSIHKPSSTLNKKGRRVTISDDSHAPSAAQITSSSSRPMSGSHLKPPSGTKGSLNIVQLNMSLNVKQKAARLTIDSLRSRGMKTPRQDKDLGRILQKLVTTENIAPKNASLSSDGTSSHDDSPTLRPLPTGHQAAEQIDAIHKRKERKQSCIPDNTPISRDLSNISTTERRTASQSSRLSSIKSAGVRLPRHVEKTLEAGMVADMTPNYFSLNSSLQTSLSSNDDTEGLNKLFARYTDTNNAKEVPVHRCQSSLDRNRLPNTKKSVKKPGSMSVAECEYQKSTNRDGVSMILTGVPVQKPILPEVLAGAQRQIKLISRGSVNSSAEQSICSVDHTPNTLLRPSSSFEADHKKDVGSKNPWKRGAMATSGTTSQSRYLSQSHVKNLISNTNSIEQSLNENLTESELAHIEALGQRRLKPEDGSTWITIGGIARPGSGIGMRRYTGRKRSGG